MKSVQFMNLLFAACYIFLSFVMGTMLIFSPAKKDSHLKTTQYSESLQSGSSIGRSYAFEIAENLKTGQAYE